MFATTVPDSIHSLVPLLIPIVAILSAFGVKALRIMRENPTPAGPKAEDLAKLRRMMEALEQMEARITVLETLLKEDQEKKTMSHEKKPF